MRYRQSLFFNCFLVFFFLITTGISQELTIGAQIRPRPELRNGFKTLTESDRDAAFFIEQRTRLFTDYRNSDFRVRINLQDVRTWGSVDQIYKTDPNLFNMYEAWGEYYFNSKISFRLGRMELDYNDDRFFGNLEWAAQGRSHDALVFIYEDDSSKWKLHVGGAFNQAATPPEQARLFGTFYTGVSNYKTMQYGWFQKEYSNTDFSILFQNDGRQATSAVDTTVAFRQTYGIMANHKFSPFALGGEFYYQGGENAANTSISAFLVAAYFTWNTELTPLTMGIDYLSGTSFTDTKDKSFEPLYGTNHKFYGFMDYFYVGNFHGQAATTSGLSDVFFKANWKLSTKTRLTGHWHFFSSQPLYSTLLTLHRK